MASPLFSRPWKRNLEGRLCALPYNKRFVNDEFREKISPNCTLVVHPEDWLIEYKANTFEEEEDLKYKVVSSKIGQFLFDLKKNLQLYLNTKDEKGAKPDVEALRDMIIRFKGPKPGVYLTDTFYLISSWEEYREVETYCAYARQAAQEILKQNGIPVPEWKWKERGRRKKK